LDRKHGRGLLHFIGRDRPLPLDAWIRRRVFPGAYAPTLDEAIEGTLVPARMSVLDVENLRLHYALTLKHWRQRYERAIAQRAPAYDVLERDALGRRVLVQGVEGLQIPPGGDIHLTPSQAFLLDTTMIVRAPNFFRWNADGAQWNAGTGWVAYNVLGWRKVNVIEDNYSFGWTSAAGFIAEFCALGGKVTKRVLPPLNTTDYSSYVTRVPSGSTNRWSMNRP
jgi:hypothetical protein